MCVVFKGNHQFIGPHNSERVLYSISISMCALWIMLAKLDVLQIPNY